MNLIEQERDSLRQQLVEAQAAIVVKDEALKVTAIKCFNIGKLHGHEDTVEACFIPVMPQDLSTYDAELVEEMLCDGSLPEAKQALQPNCGQPLLEVVKEMKEALNKIASWREGESVDSSFDEPCSASIAREALTKAKEIGL